MELYLSAFAGLTQGINGTMPIAKMPGIASTKLTIPTDTSAIAWNIARGVHIIRCVAGGDCSVYFQGWRDGSTRGGAETKLSIDVRLLSGSREYISVPEDTGNGDWANVAINVVKDTA